MDPNKPKMPPVPPDPQRNPSFKSAGVELPPLPPSFKEDAYDLAEGRAVFRWPDQLTKESVEELKDWLNLIIRKMTRMVRIGTIKDVAGTNAPVIPIGGGRAIILPEDDQ